MTDLTKPIDQEIALIQHYFDCKNLNEAARLAGYSESTIKSGYIKSKFKDPAFKTKYIEQLITCDLLDLPLIYNIEYDLIKYANDLVKDDKEKALRYYTKLKHITTQKKQITGILRDQEAPKSPTTINVDRIQVLMGNLSPKLEHKTQDIENGKIIDVPNGQQDDK